MSECPVCSRSFDSDQGMKIHKAQAHNRLEPWQDKTTMRYLYHTRGLSSNEIADVLPCNRGNVKRWLRRHGIEMRSPSEAAQRRALREPPTHRFHQGYEEVCTQVNGRQKVIGIHRLVAVAEYGFDAVRGKETHHKNGIPWDNRPENIKPMSRSEHAKQHYENGDLEIEPGGIADSLEDSA